MVFQTRITIRWYPGKLTQDANLMLTFKPPCADKLSHQQNMVAWKLITMKAKPGAAINQVVITYKARLGFGCNTLDNGNIVGVSSVIECDLGQSVTLTEEDGVPFWNDPVKGNAPKLIKAHNNTDYKRLMSVGTLEPEYLPAFLWNVGAGNSIEAEFHPVLMGFVNLGYKESEFITADITSASIWNQNLASLPSSSTWEFKEGDQGNYSLTRLGA